MGVNKVSMTECVSRGCTVHARNTKTSKKAESTVGLQGPLNRAI